MDRTHIGARSPSIDLNRPQSGRANQGGPGPLDGHKLSVEQPLAPRTAGAQRSFAAEVKLLFARVVLQVVPNSVRSDFVQREAQRVVGARTADLMAALQARPQATAADPQIRDLTQSLKGALARISDSSMVQHQALTQQAFAQAGNATQDQVDRLAALLGVPQKAALQTSRSDAIGGKVCANVQADRASGTSQVGNDLARNFKATVTDPQGQPKPTSGVELRDSLSASGASAEAVATAIQLCAQKNFIALQQVARVGTTAFTLQGAPVGLSTQSQGATSVSFRAAADGSLIAKLEMRHDNPSFDVMDAATGGMTAHPTGPISISAQFRIAADGAIATHGGVELSGADGLRGLQFGSATPEYEPRAVEAFLRALALDAGPGYRDAVQQTLKAASFSLDTNSPNIENFKTQLAGKKTKELVALMAKLNSFSKATTGEWQAQTYEQTLGPLSPIIESALTASLARDLGAEVGARLDACVAQAKDTPEAVGASFDAAANEIQAHMNKLGLGSKPSADDVLARSVISLFKARPEAFRSVVDQLPARALVALARSNEKFPGALGVALNGALAAKAQGPLAAASQALKQLGAPGRPGQDRTALVARAHAQLSQLRELSQVPIPGLPDLSKQCEGMQRNLNLAVAQANPEALLTLRNIAASLASAVAQGDVAQTFNCLTGLQDASRVVRAGFDRHDMDLSAQAVIELATAHLQPAQKDLLGAGMKALFPPMARALDAARAAQFDGALNSQGTRGVMAQGMQREQQLGQATQWMEHLLRSLDGQTERPLPTASRPLNDPQRAALAKAVGGELPIAPVASRPLSSEQRAALQAQLAVMANEPHVASRLDARAHENFADVGRGLPVFLDTGGSLRQLGASGAGGPAASSTTNVTADMDELTDAFSGVSPEVLSFATRALNQNGLAAALAAVTDDLGVHIAKIQPQPTCSLQAASDGRGGLNLRGVIHYADQPGPAQQLLHMSFELHIGKDKSITLAGEPSIVHNLKAAA